MGLTREQLLRKLDVISDAPDLESITKKSLVEISRKEWQEPEKEATSFYASQFPGKENLCCNTRGLLYSLMNIPHLDPFPTKLSGQAAMGNAAEAFVINAWNKAGILIGGTQVYFEDEETWISGRTDAILDLSPEIKSVLPVDVKSKDHDVIQQMKIGAREYDPKHYLQVQCYIYLCRKFHDQLDTKLEPAKSGMLYYVSRQDPTFVKAFYFDADEEVIEKSVEILKNLKQNFLDGELPPVPEGHQWSKDLARFCPFKKECCKKDFKDGITKLCDSNSIEFAKTVRPSYDYEEKRRKVLERWS